MAEARASVQQKAEDAQLMIEMRYDKAAVDLNRALFDYGAEAERV